ncbi:hypothetical protein [uncultured Sphingomonas sp.]|uniref:hypothetical protein n=1 Tax=uncultured Sphingomonas sp. TaxID=158754 RepID=UPI0037483D9D
MTKVRAAGTIEDALFRVLGHIGVDRAAEEVLGISGDYLRRLSDPDSRYRLTVEDAIKLDLAYLAAGGGAAPIYQTYTLLLDQANAERFSDREELVRRTATAMKEGGDADAALVLATLPGATPADRERARREVHEAIEAKAAVLACLDDPAPP